MTWTYSGNPASSSLDAVRFLCGDTDTNNQLIPNEGINFLLSEWNSDTYLAAAFACDAIAGTFAAQADSSRTVGDLSISTQFGSQARTFLERAAALRAQASRRYPPLPNFDTTVFDGTYSFTIGMDKNEQEI